MQKVFLFLTILCFTSCSHAMDKRPSKADGGEHTNKHLLSNDHDGAKCTEYRGLIVKCMVDDEQVVDDGCQPGANFGFCDEVCPHSCREIITIDAFLPEAFALCNPAAKELDGQEVFVVSKECLNKAAVAKGVSLGAVIGWCSAIFGGGLVFGGVCAGFFILYKVAKKNLKKKQAEED